MLPHSGPGGRTKCTQTDTPTGNSPKWIKPTGATTQEAFPPFFLCCSFPALELGLNLSEWNYVWCCTDVFASLVFPGCFDKLDHVRKDFC